MIRNNEILTRISFLSIFETKFLKYVGRYLILPNLMPKDKLHFYLNAKCTFELQ